MHRYAVFALFVLAVLLGSSWALRQVYVANHPEELTNVSYHNFAGPLDVRDDGSVVFMLDGFGEYGDLPVEFAAYGDNARTLLSYDEAMGLEGFRVRITNTVPEVYELVDGLRRIEKLRLTPNYHDATG